MHSVLGRAAGTVGLLGFLSLLVLASPAGAVTIGSDLSGNALIGGPGGCPCTFVPTESHAVVVPEAGVLTAWRFKSMSSFDLKGEIFRLVVLKGNTAVAIDSQVLPSRPEFQQNLYEFKASIPVESGERLGLEGRGDVFTGVQDPSVYMSQWDPPLKLNETAPPLFENGHFEYELLFNADIGVPSLPPSGSGSSGGGSSGGGAPTGKVKLLNGGPNPTILTTKSGQFTDPAKCELPPGSPFTCSGAVVLNQVKQDLVAPGFARAAAKKKGAVIGKGSFNIAPGQTANVKVKLKPPAVAALKKAGKLKGYLTTTSNLTDGTKSSLTQNLTIKYRKPKHH